jgi:hypothetical protein
MIKYQILFFLLSAITLPNIIDAQRFGGGITLAGTLSQIAGDDVYGFHKGGFELGIYGRAQLSEISDLEIHFSYNQRGSQSTSTDYSIVDINLHYIDVPVLFVLKDWPEAEGDKKFYHMNFFGGLSAGYLISSNSLTGVDKNFNKTDISWILGASYFNSKNWGFTGKYTRAISALYKYAKPNVEVEIISYFISLGLNYKFN